MKKVIAIVLSVVMLLALFIPAFARTDSQITITNPYADVNWDSVKAYKAALHTHTNNSDGDPTMKEQIERHIQCGFDIVAITDHGTVNYSWEDTEENIIYKALQLVGKSEGSLVVPGTNGTFEKLGVDYSIVTKDGDDILTCSNGKQLLRVPYGIENNAVSANAHVNSWFVDFHNNGLTTYDNALKNINNLGGVCVINHPGEYSKARYEIKSEDAYNTDDFSYWYLVNKFANYINKYDACIGIDINSKGDSRTRFDRILWDNLLTRFASNGKNVFAICSSDAHRFSVVDSGFTYILMDELSSKSMKNAMSKGQMFGGSHCLGNPDEIKQYSDAILGFYGPDNAFGLALKDMYDKMAKKVADIENGNEDADEDIGYTFDILDSEGFFNGPSQPMINKITVDDSLDTITIEAENSLIVRWVSEGKQVLSSKVENGKASINLAEIKDLGCYVRAEVLGEGGVLYSEPFIIDNGNVSARKIVDTGFIDFGILDCLVGIFENWGDILGRML